jgi:polyhydroxybutyrate depolymerase
MTSRFRRWAFALGAVVFVAGASLVGALSASGNGLPPLPDFVPTDPAPTPKPKYRAVVADVAVDRTGCEALPSNIRPGGETVWTLPGARPRQYLVHFPQTGRTGQKLPLVLNFHGLAADGQIQADLSGFHAVADRNGFIVVSPDGSGEPRGWNALLRPLGAGDDVAFTGQLLDKLEQDFCVDTARVYAAGFSSGAMMASRLACRLGSRVAAAGAVAGVYKPAEQCGRPVPVVAVHGTADDTVPFEQGRIIEQTPYPGAHAAISAWASSGSTCTPTAELFTMTPSVAREQFRGCGRNESLLYIVYGGGHTWPDELATADILWSFFRDHPMPAETPVKK